MTQTNTEQWAVELWRKAFAAYHGPTYVSPDRAGEVIQAAFAEREARNLSDTQRLLWRDELGDICPSLDVCFDGSDRVRCGPCAIEAAKAKGVDPDYTLPNLPEVSRLKRENARLVGALESANTLLTKAVGDIVALNIMAGKRSSKSFTAEYVEAINAIDATLAALKDRTDG